LEDGEAGEEEREDQRAAASEARVRHLDFLASEAERGQQHGRALTDEAIQAANREWGELVCLCYGKIHNLANNLKMNKLNHKHSHVFVCNYFVVKFLL